MGAILFWSRIRESNPPSRLGKPLYYRYTNPALCEGIIPEGIGKFNPILSKPAVFLSVINCSLKCKMVAPDYPTRMSLRGAKRRGNLLPESTILHDDT